MENPGMYAGCALTTTAPPTVNPQAQRDLGNGDAHTIEEDTKRSTRKFASANTPAPMRNLQIY